MIKIEMLLEEIEYEALFDRLFPVLQERLGESDEPAARLMSGLPAPLARKVLEGLSGEQKDKIAVSVLNAGRRRVERKINEKLTEQSLALKVSDLKAEKM